MSPRSLLAATLAAATLGLAGTPASAQNNTATGAIIGGVTGAVIGGAVTGRAGGAAAGAVIGGVTGAAIGASTEKRHSYYGWSNGRCYYYAKNGSVTRVDRSFCY